MLICNKCGKTGKRGKFCVYCGGELSEFFTVKTTEEKTALGECPECGKEYFGGSFCVFCGTSLEEKNDMAENAISLENLEATEEAAVVVDMNETTSDSTVEAPTEEPVATADDEPAAIEAAEEEAIIEPVQLQCSECGKIMDKGKFCTSCGGTLVPMDAPEANAEVLPDETASIEVPVEEPLVEDVAETAPEIEADTTETTSEDEDIPADDEIVAEEAPIQNEEPAVDMPTQLKCDMCGKTFEKGKFCTVCGGNLSPVSNEPAQEDSSPVTQVEVIPPSPVMQAPANNAPVKLQCERCGKIMERGKFCTTCGGSLRPMDDKPAIDPATPVPLPMPVPTPIPAPIPQPSPAPVPQPAPVPAPQTAPTPTVSAGGTLSCPSCGKTFERGKFCTVCGTGLVQNNVAPVDNMLHCVQCGKTYERGKFCVSCGGQLVTSDKLNV